MESTIDDLDLDFDIKEEIMKREPVDSIDLYFIYIDSNLAIEKIVCENEPVHAIVGKGNGINKDHLLQLIQNKRFINNKKYKLINFFHFQVPLEQDQIQNFVKNNVIEFPEFMKSPSYLTDLIVEDSMPFFHDLNSLFLFFKSSELRTLSKTAKYIGINSDGGVGTGSRVTKKVRFVPES
jgi:hypothetical protein